MLDKNKKTLREVRQVPPWENLSFMDLVNPYDKENSCGRCNPDWDCMCFEDTGC